ncbi:type VI secretion system lipoprotein TssJ [Colwellia sp. D2M02]|uniref:type VI secretion system lipoprotein TssJ n=1 Tax=Colwellia sp. D2M02 TaxID=2841562 RepID=UPI001C08F6B5|nr:type VI secretion system lipoprotein TssJ [Colwellia sp. D2M02]MBU2894372.1 type VI secretion system lipoprotein TssJ [Colwellia sp. D2M02]
MKLVKLFTILFFASSLMACTSTQVNLDVSATDNLNMNQFDEALPIVLRIYQLSDVQGFKTASFEDLWKSDKSVLANSLITVEERTVNPSDKVSINFDQAEEAKYVAIFALFRDRSDENWRVYHELNTGTVQLSTSLDVLLTSNAITFPHVKKETE